VPYTIEYFNASVRAELDVWPPGLRARYRALVLRMSEYGPNLGMPHTRSMGEALFEVRVKAAEGVGRAFYCALAGKRIVVLHSFVKKSERTPARELKVARDRMKEVLSHA
jgi:phage-related protein